MLVGLTIGFAGALALRSIIASQLYGVGPLDPSVLGLVTVVLAIASVSRASPRPAGNARRPRHRPDAAIETGVGINFTFCHINGVAKSEIYPDPN